MLIAHKFSIFLFSVAVILWFNWTSVSCERKFFRVKEMHTDKIIRDEEEKNASRKIQQRYIQSAVLLAVIWSSGNVNEPTM